MTDTYPLLQPPLEPVGGQDVNLGRPGLLGMLPIIARTVPQVMAWIGLHRSWPVGYCLSYCRQAHGLPGVYPSAIAAWEAAELKHRGDRTPPKGVPCFYRGGQFGHVVISAGNGMVESTDALVRGRVDLVPLSSFEAAWGYVYLGWTADLNGRRVWRRPSWVSLADLRAASSKDPHRPVGLHPNQTNRIRAALGLSRATGRWSKAVARRWHARYPQSNGRPTVASLRDFCTKHGLDYRP